MVLNLDVINACFEACGAITLLKSCWMTFKAKSTVGISALQVAFFSGWGYFNCFYYPSLNQSYSFVAGLCLAIVNTFWVGQIIYYRRKNEISKQII